MEAKQFVSVYLVFGEHYGAYEFVGIFGCSLLGRSTDLFNRTIAMVTKSRVMGFVHPHVNSLQSITVLAINGSED